MAGEMLSSGHRELAQARRQGRGAFWAVGSFSFFVNLLMLTGPLYMLNVYDNVLGSRSIETLLALTLLVAFLYLSMGLLDMARARLMARFGAQFQSRLDRRVFSASMRASALARAQSQSATALRDLESVQRLLTSPALMALFDLPWTPLFFFGIFLFHPWLGYLAICGGGLLVVIALLNQALSFAPLNRLSSAGFHADTLASQIRSEAEIVQSLGMRDASFARWQMARSEALGATIAASDMTGGFGALTKAIRLFLQSSMLGLGAYLTLRGEMTAGAMIAGSILLGRALAPVEVLVTQWSQLERAREGWRNLSVLLTEIPEQETRTSLPAPKAVLDIHQLTVVPPGHKQAALRMLSFRGLPGQAIGVIGPSGAGKSTLARAVCGAWGPAAGTIRLDGATLDHYDPDLLGSYIGYLPQRVQLFDGTIKENIARMSLTADDAAVHKAAIAAAAHDMILSLPQGYDTQIRSSAGSLSGGQIQRIGLARALYGDPVMLVLDEPNSNLDNDGTDALNHAIRTFKASQRLVLIMAHRPAAIQECDMLLMLEGGARQAFGPTKDVLRQTVQNHHDIARSRKLPGGMI